MGSEIGLKPIRPQFNNIHLPIYFLRTQRKRVAEKDFELFEIKYCPKMTLSNSKCCPLKINKDIKK